MISKFELYITCNSINRITLLELKNCVSVLIDVADEIVLWACGMFESARFLYYVHIPV